MVGQMTRSEVFFILEDDTSNDIGHKCTQDMYGVSSKVCSAVIDVQ